MSDAFTILKDALRAKNKTAGVNVVGELLRSITFIGEGIGCYENFDVRSDAENITKQLDDLNREFELLLNDEDIEIATAFRFYDYGIRIIVIWFWESDGTLIFYFDCEQGSYIIRNDDCKNDHSWRISSRKLI